MKELLVEYFYKEWLGDNSLTTRIPGNQHGDRETPGGPVQIKFEGRRIISFYYIRVCNIVTFY